MRPVTPWAKSFHGLVRTPGGKALVGQKHRERGEDQFGPNPCPSSRPIPSRQLIQIKQGFEPLEEQLDLPSSTVQFANLFGGQFLLRKVGKKPYRLALGI